MTESLKKKKAMTIFAKTKKTNQTYLNNSTSLKSAMTKKDLGKKISLKKERKFKVGDLHSHVSMFLKKFRVGKNPKTKFYEKRGR